MQHHNQQFNSEKNGSVEKTKLQKSVKNTLTDLSSAANLEIAPESQQANRRVSRQITGGKVDSTQPPHVSGFFVPVNLSGDDTSLPRGCEIQKRLRVNTCGGLPVSHLETRGSFKTVSAKTQDNIQESTAMNANTHGIATPVAATPGASSDQCNDCLLPSSVLSDVIQHAKQEAASRGKFGTSDAYAKLLKHFHAAILPALIDETGGNTSAMARLLGLHRDSVKTYAGDVGLTHLIGRKGQGGQS